VHIHTNKHTKRCERSLTPDALHVASSLVCIWEERVELLFTCGVICTESHHANMMWALTDTADIYFFLTVQPNTHTERFADIKTVQNLPSRILLGTQDNIISYVWNAINSTRQHPNYKKSSFLTGVTVWRLTPIRRRQASD
jgi:hypothetical protein